MFITKTRTWIIATLFTLVVAIATLSGPAAALAAVVCRTRTGC